MKPNSRNKYWKLHLATSHSFCVASSQCDQFDSRWLKWLAGCANLHTVILICMIIEFACYFVFFFLSFLPFCACLCFLHACSFNLCAVHSTFHLHGKTLKQNHHPLVEPHATLTLTSEPWPRGSPGVAALTPCSASSPQQSHDAAESGGWYHCHCRDGKDNMCEIIIFLLVFMHVKSRLICILFLQTIRQVHSVWTTAITHN